MKDYVRIIEALRRKGYYLKKTGTVTEFWDHRNDAIPAVVIRKGKFSDMAEIFVEDITEEIIK